MDITIKYSFKQTQPNMIETGEFRAFNKATGMVTVRARNAIRMFPYRYVTLHSYHYDRVSCYLNNTGAQSSDIWNLLEKTKQGQTNSPEPKKDKPKILFFERTDEHI